MCIWHFLIILLLIWIYWPGAFVNIDITDFKVCDSPVEILWIVDHLTTIYIKKSCLCLFIQNCTWNHVHFGTCIPMLVSLQVVKTSFSTSLRVLKLWKCHSSLHCSSDQVVESRVISTNNCPLQDFNLTGTIKLYSEVVELILGAYFQERHNIFFMISQLNY